MTSPWGTECLGLRIAAAGGGAWAGGLAPEEVGRFAVLAGGGAADRIGALGGGA